MLQLLTAVLRDCEFSGKITFSYRKKFYLSRKFSVTKFATSQSRETLGANADPIDTKNQLTKTSCTISKI